MRHACSRRRAPSHAWRPSCWIHRYRNEQAFERHSKGRCRQPLAPTKAMNRMRAIASNRTQSSLTGGCFEHRARPAGRNRPGQRPLSVASSSRRANETASWSRGVAHVRAAVRSRSEDERRRCPHPSLREPSTAMRKRQDRIAHLSLRSTWRARNSQRSINASHCSFESLAHNSRRGGAALLIRTSEEFEQPHRVTPG